MRAADALLLDNPAAAAARRADEAIDMDDRTIPQPSRGGRPRKPAGEATVPLTVRVPARVFDAWQQLDAEERRAVRDALERGVTRAAKRG